MTQKIDLLFAAIKNKGIRGTTAVALADLFDYTFDLKYGTDTMSWVSLKDIDIDSENVERGVDYQPTRALALRSLFSKLKLPKSYTLLDIGSGKGRVLLLGAEYGFRKVRGVEFASELCRIAERNSDIFQNKFGNQTNFETIETDASKFQFHDDENVIFMFNPFDDIVTEKVADNLAESLERQPRPCCLIYRNALYRDIIERIPGIEPIHDFVVWGQDFIVYSNRVAPMASASLH